MQHMLYSGLTQRLFTPWFLIFLPRWRLWTPRAVYCHTSKPQPPSALHWADNTGLGEELPSLTLVFFCGVARDIING
jgi:hypothetical protein